MRVYLKNEDRSVRQLGEFPIACLSEGYKIVLYQGNEQSDRVQSLRYSLVKGDSNVADMKYFGGTADFDRENAFDFKVTCRDSLVYIIFEDSDTVKRIDLSSIKE